LVKGQGNGKGVWPRQRKGRRRILLRVRRGDLKRKEKKENPKKEKEKVKGKGLCRADGAADV